MSLLEPIELTKTLKSVDRSLDYVAVLDLVLIGFVFLLLGSRFIYAPGLTVDMGIELPVSRTGSLQGLPSDSVLTLAVLSSKSDNMHIFDGNIVSLAGLQSAFDDFFGENRGSGESTLLVKLDQRVSMGTFVQIAETAREAGFARVQIAAETMANSSSEE